MSLANEVLFSGCAIGTSILYHGVGSTAPYILRGKRVFGYPVQLCNQQSIKPKTKDENQQPPMLFPKAKAK